MKRVLVLGDTILDHYVFGNVSRVNPEAKYSVVLDAGSNEEIRLGGACNVAANIRGILGEHCAIHYYGVVSDSVCEMLMKYHIAYDDTLMIDDKDILLKTRYVCDNHHLLRVDRGTHYTLKGFGPRLKYKIKQYDYDLIVVSDYNKGAINIETTEAVIESGIKTIVDLKKRQNLFLVNVRKEDAPFLSKDVVSNSSHVIIKCNASEFDAEVSKSMIETVGAVIKTSGADGCYVYQNDDIQHIPAPQVQVADVVGAGDVFLAGMAARYLETDSWNAMEMASSGTQWASEKVKYFGTHVIER